MIDIYNKDLYQRCEKKNYIIECCIPPKDIEIYNHLEDSHCNINNISRVLMRGLLNEIWLIDLETLMNSYRFMSGEEITMETLQQKGRMIDDELIMNWQEIIKKSATDKYCQFIPKMYKFEIKTKYNTTLHINSENSPSNHGDGDYIMCSIKKDGTPDLSNMWVVDGNVFEKTYKIKKK